MPLFDQLASATTVRAASPAAPAAASRADAAGELRVQRTKPTNTRNRN